jgi:putative oxidoreductase
MNNFLRLGKYIFAIPMAVFGVMHILSAEVMATDAPGGIIVVYLTGIGLMAASISIFIGKYDKLACILLGLMLILFIIPHLLKINESPLEIINILKNISLAGGAFMCATIAKDSSYIK